jgi:hypothetical protein
VFFAVLTVWNARKYLKLRTSPIPPLISALVLLWLILLYFDEYYYASIVILVTVLIAVAFLPSSWRDMVKVLRYENINPKEGIKFSDYFSWGLFIKLGYRFGVKISAFLYALNYSVVFAICYCVFGTLLSMKFSCIVALLVAVIILPVNYYLAKKIIDALISKRKC